MRKKHELFGFLRKLGIQKQLYTIYMLAVLIPVSLIGTFLVGNYLQAFDKLSWRSAGIG